MAKLVTCKACGNDVAKSAKVCPHCGAKTKRGCGCGVVIAALLVIAAVALVSFAFNKAGEAHGRAEEIVQQRLKQKADEERAKVASMTPEQREEYLKEQKRQQLANQFADKFERKFDGSIKPVVEYVKANMKNPDSFKHVKTEWFIRSNAEREYIVRMQYRGTNSFNAVVTETVELIVSQDGTILSE